MATITTTGPVIGTPPVVFKEEDPHLGGPLPDTSGLPTGFPKAVQTKLAWTGAQFTDESQYVHYLTGADIQELEAALKTFKALDLDGDQVRRENFPLPGLGLKLDGASREIHEGIGFALIRGLDPEKYSVEDLTILQLGIQGYIANRQGRQDKRGNMLVHIVADDSTRLKAKHHRHSTKSIAFHTEEAADVVSWLTRSTAATGGKCVIASAHTVYNILAAASPGMIRTLAGSDWPFGFPRFQCRPVIFYQDSELIMNFGRAALLGNAIHPRPEGVPQVSGPQLEALNAIEAIAEATKLEIQTRAGDLHFINNLAVLHRREAFTDGQDAKEKRHLVRMLLRNDQLAWETPAELQRDWHDTFHKQGDRIWHLEPMPEGFFPMRGQPN